MKHEALIIQSDNWEDRKWVSHQRFILHHYARPNIFKISCLAKNALFFFPKTSVADDLLAHCLGLLAAYLRSSQGEGHSHIGILNKQMPS